jgi:hypothetical protein
MNATKHRTLTPYGVAKLILRGIRANFAPDNQNAEVERFVEYLQDLAMSRGMHSELADVAASSAKQAREDAEWLDAIACELEEISEG